MVLGKICRNFILPLLPLTMTLAAPEAKADAWSDFSQKLTTCNVDPSQVSQSQWQECYNVLRGSIFLTAVGLNQTNDALRNQCNQNPTPPNLNPEYSAFFEEFTKCNVEPSQVDANNWQPCYHVLRGGIWIYAASLNEAKVALNQCTQPPTTATTTNSTITNSLSTYQSPTTRTVLDGGSLIENNPEPAIQYRYTSPSTTTGTVLNSGSWFENNPEPAITY